VTADLRSSRAYQFHRILWQAIDWIYPPRCAGCSAPGFRFCASCASRVKTIDQGKVCPLCGVPQPTSEVCPECRSYTPAFTAVRSWGLYEGTLREAIHHLKYRSDLGVSEELARPLSALIKALGWQVDLIAPVPLSQKRLRSRGYNQASMLARWVAMTNGIPFHPAALDRSKDTISQVGLSGEERRKNVIGAFTASKAAVSGKSILIIDDVTTTGATMQACSLALREGGADRIYGLTLARAGHIHLS